MNSKKFNSNKLLYIILIALLVVVVFFAFFNTGNTKNYLTTEQVNAMFTETDPQKDQIEKWYVYKNNKIVFKIKSSETNFPKYYDYYTSYNYEIYENWLEKYGDKLLDVKPPSASIWDTIYPILMIVLALLFIFFMFRMFSGKNSGTMGFGKSKARQAQNVKVRFSDIAGAEEEKTELRELVDFLKYPQRFTALGARIPKGVLLVGPPGTGKTLLARAVAGESGVPFLSISGSDFVEMFVGVGASRVRDLFEQAKANAPCIVFIDEIDAVGRQRGTGLGGGNDEREQTLNQLLVELDGFEANQGIIVLAATNRSDVLDPALLRPGRFDRQVYVYPPDVRGREGILRIHAKNKPLAKDVNFTALARITSGFTGADIENMLNESAILAARDGRNEISMSDITEGIDKVLMGPKKKSTLVTENDKKLTAYHEAGHAILHKKLKHAEEVHEVSIIPRGMAAGYTSSRPINDDHSLTLNKVNDILACFMGGRLGEYIGLGEVDAGANNDIKRATNIARRMVTEFGMSEKFGFMGFESGDQVFLGRDYQEKNVYSEKTAAEIDSEVKKILDYNYNRAKKIIEENKDLLDNLAKLLIEKETIYTEELDMLLEGKSVEEIVKVMDKKEKVRVAKDKKLKAVNEKLEKLRELEVKLKTSEVFLKHGIINQGEFDTIKHTYEECKKEFEQQEKKTSKKNNEKLETKTEKQVENNNKTEEQGDKK